MGEEEEEGEEEEGEEEEGEDCMYSRGIMYGIGIAGSKAYSSLGER